MIYDQLRTARIKKKLSQAQLGAKIGTAQGYVSNAEAGKIDMRLSSFIQMARVLDLELTLVPRHLTLLVKSIVSNDGKPERKPLWAVDDYDDE